MQPHYLIAAVWIILAAIAIIVILTYSRLYFKKRIHLYNTGIRRQLEHFISDMIFYEPEERPGISREFVRIVKNPLGRRLIVDELINCKKNFTGVTAQNIVALYEQLDLKKYSLRKLNSGKWHIKARGIQELYLMGQSDTIKRIYRHINNKHEFVRMEAQSGVIHLLGFEGLRFLDVIDHPLTEWQQLKLLEQLGHLKMNVRLSAAIPRWLRSPNDTVVLFGLKLITEFQQLALHDEVLQCLSHTGEAVRVQAVATLVRIADEKTARSLAAHFPRETPAGKLAILDGLIKIATEEQAPFLTGLLDDDHETAIVKLKAGKALALNSDNGLAILAGMGARRPHPYEEIYLHIKSEITK